MYIGFFFITLAYYIGWEFLDGMGHHSATLIPLALGYICMLRAMFTKAGYISSYVEIDKEKKYTTTQQNFIDTFSYKTFLKPNHAHWSRRTKKMVIDYDHFCEWLSNDIGLFNFRFFVQFLFWTTVNCLVTFALTFKVIWECVHDWDYWSCNMVMNHKAVVVSLYFVSMFGLFLVGDLFLDAIKTIRTGWGTVDRMKGADRIKGNNTWKLYFGNAYPLGLLYVLLPLPNDYRIAYRKKMMEKKCGEFFEKKGLKVVYK